MRGASVDSQQRLYPNASTAEGSSNWFKFTSQGFTPNTYFDGDLIYIAIRRPMKTPESGTEVFSPVARTGTGTTAAVTGVGFSPDLFIGNILDTAGYWNGVVDRLRGVPKRLVSSQTNAEDTQTVITSFDMDGLSLTSDSNGFANENGKTYIQWLFKRATGFFDVVAFSGSSTLSERTYNHNLGVQPELIIIKGRSGSYASGDWNVATNQGAKNGESIDTTKNHTGFQLNATNGITFGTSQNWSDVCSTTTFTTNGAASYITNSSGNTIQWSAGTDFIAYLFATLAGVSKVGSYTGTNTTNNIDCGFSSSARFILIKRTDSSGDWYVWDSARGITVGNDPYLTLNTTAAQLYPGSDVIQPYSSGFTLTNNAGSGINGNGGTYIFLAIA
jgi:hypothetical protein